MDDELLPFNFFHRRYVSLSMRARKAILKRGAANVVELRQKDVKGCGPKTLVEIHHFARRKPGRKS